MALLDKSGKKWNSGTPENNTFTFFSKRFFSLKITHLFAEPLSYIEMVKSWPLKP